MGTLEEMPRAISKCVDGALPNAVVRLLIAFAWSVAAGGLTDVPAATFIAARPDGAIRCLLIHDPIDCLISATSASDIVQYSLRDMSRTAVLPTSETSLKGCALDASSNLAFFGAVSSDGTAAIVAVSLSPLQLTTRVPLAGVSPRPSVLVLHEPTRHLFVVGEDGWLLKIRVDGLIIAGQLQLPLGLSSSISWQSAALNIQWRTAYVGDKLFLSDPDGTRSDGIFTVGMSAFAYLGQSLAGIPVSALAVDQSTGYLYAAVPMPGFFLLLQTTSLLPVIQEYSFQSIAETAFIAIESGSNYAFLVSGSVNPVMLPVSLDGTFTELDRLQVPAPQISAAIVHRASATAILGGTDGSISRVALSAGSVLQMDVTTQQIPYTLAPFASSLLDAETQVLYVALSQAPGVLLRLSAIDATPLRSLLLPATAGVPALMDADEHFTFIYLTAGPSTTDQSGGLLQIRLPDMSLAGHLRAASEDGRWLTVALPKPGAAVALVGVWPSNSSSAGVILEVDVTLMARSRSLRLQLGEGGPVSCILDVSEAAGYWALQSSVSQPASIIKVNLDTLTRVATLPIAASAGFMPMVLLSPGYALLTTSSVADAHLLCTVNLTAMVVDVTATLAAGFASPSFQTLMVSAPLQTAFVAGDSGTVEAFRLSDLQLVGTASVPEGAAIISAVIGPSSTDAWMLAARAPATLYHLQLSGMVVDSVRPIVSPGSQWPAASLHASVTNDLFWGTGDGALGAGVICKMRGSDCSFSSCMPAGG